MKKIISIILALVTIMSICSLSFSSLAASKVTYQTTYQARETNYKNSYGSVYTESGRLMSEYNNKVYLIETISGEFGSCERVRFYLRGKTVYYEINGTYYSATLDGSNKKTIKKLNNNYYFFGGYGKNLVVYNSKNEYFYFLSTSGTLTKLFNLPYSCPKNIFGGKIYYRYNDEPYLNTFDLETKKTTRFALKIHYGDSFLFAKNYLYYINQSSRTLMRMDASGNKVKIYPNVKEILSATDGSVVLVKLSYYGDNIYKISGTNKPVKITSENAIEKALKKIYPNPFYDKLYGGLKGSYIAGGKAFFVVDHWAYEDLATDILIYDIKNKTFEKYATIRQGETSHGITMTTNGNNVYINLHNYDFAEHEYTVINLDLDYPFVKDPSGKVTVNAKDGKANLSWPKLAKVTGYRVYKTTRITTKDGNYEYKLEYIGSVKGASNTKFTDTKAKSGSTYRYVVVPYKVVNSAMHEYSHRWYGSGFVNV